MIYAMLKSCLKILFKNLIKNCFNNTEPKLLNYRNLRNLPQEAFKEDHSKALCDCSNSYDDLNHMFTPKLYKHDPKNVANAFIDRQFNYAPLIWMFAGKTLINKICKIIIEHIRWFTMNIINHKKNFFNSTITCLFIKDLMN